MLQPSTMDDALSTYSTQNAEFPAFDACPINGKWQIAQDTCN